MCVDVWVGGVLVKACVRMCNVYIVDVHNLPNVHEALCVYTFNVACVRVVTTDGDQLFTSLP